MKQIYAHDTAKGLAPVYMGRMEVDDRIDSETVHVLVPFVIGDYTVTRSIFKIRGRLNICSNTFHWDTMNEADCTPYFEGYDIDIPREIEKR